MDVRAVFQRVRGAVDKLDRDTNADTRRDAAEAVVREEAITSQEDRRDYGLYGKEVLLSWTPADTFFDLANLTTAIYAMPSSSWAAASNVALKFIKRHVGQELDADAWHQIEVCIDQILHFYRETPEPRDLYELVECVKNAAGLPLEPKTKMVIEIMRRRSRSDIGGGWRIEEAIHHLFRGYTGIYGDAEFKRMAANFVNEFGLDDWAIWLADLDYPTEQENRELRVRSAFLDCCFDDREPLLLTPVRGEDGNSVQYVLRPQSFELITHPNQAGAVIEDHGARLERSSSSSNWTDGFFLEEVADRRSRDWIDRKIRQNRDRGSGGDNIIPLPPRGEPK